MGNAADGLSWFLNEAGRVPLLTPEEELILARTVQEWVARRDEPGVPRQLLRRGERAYKRMFEANLRLVATIAKRYTARAKHLDLSDLLQEGCLGLGRAIERYDPQRGYKFSTYAYWWIRQGITRGIQVSDRAIRLPMNAFDGVVKLRSWLPVATQERGTMPTAQECADYLGSTLDAAERYLAHLSDVASLDTPCKTDRECNTVGDMVACPSSPLEDSVLSEVMVDEVQFALEQLSPYERDLLELRYGVTTDNCEPMTIRGVAQIYKRDRRRLAADEEEAIAKLRRSFHLGIAA